MNFAGVDLAGVFALIGVGAIAGSIAGFTLARLIRPRGRHRHRRVEPDLDDDD
jgi:hypothetical protein